MAGLCVLCMAGCSSVTMKEPFPESQLTEEEQEQLEGIWRIDDGIVHIAFASNGVPWLAMVEWEDGDFQMDKYRLHFTRHKEAFYVCIPTEPGGTNKYVFAEFNPNADPNLFFWDPDIAFFTEQIRIGALKGSVEKGQYSTEINLESSSVEILDLISTNHAAFDYKNPLLFQKLD